MTCRVLSLDGGGAWALIQVLTLMDLYGEAASGHQVLANFDLVAASSGGSLVLAGLVENLSLDNILQYFMDEQKRRSIFSPTTSLGDNLLQTVLGVGPKYSANAKLPAIERLLPTTGDSPLAGAMDGVVGPAGKPVHLLIVGFDYDRNRAIFFRSAPATQAGWGTGQPATVTLAGAVHASTNAPVNYFDAPADLPDAPGRFWDGGITGCNNPAVSAVVEALVLGYRSLDIRVLSLGTATVIFPLADPGVPPKPLEAPRPDSSLITDLKKLAAAILDDPPDAATFIAHVMTGANAGVPPSVVSRVVRMSPLVSPLPAAGGEWRPPPGWSLAQFKYLANIDMDAVAQTDITYIDDYCRHWLVDNAPNQPIRMSGGAFDPQHPEIGYAKFSEAKAAWRVLFP
ncbi:MAG TPA: patatin-like phospholipase family protein [Stellaceae bacterium]|nr:patatin-like phospholipase family protein [Stellaceae bacterium]